MKDAANARRNTRSSQARPRGRDKASPRVFLVQSELPPLISSRVQKRERLLKRPREAGIGTGIHYPIPLHLQNAYKDLGYCEGNFPVSKTAASQILSLPMFP
ncbi:MAG: DegT/DnrJ/EryC1/StrS family aminotransferase [Terriglobia bacterium]